MNERDISELLKKADELRSLFVLGQRVIPFLEEIFVFVSEIEPLLNEINKSIEDNLSKMPNASKQLSKVTEATELATTEIMDIVDGLVYKSDIITNNIKELHDIQKNLNSKPLELLKILVNGIEKGENLKPVLPELNEIIAKLENEKNEKFIEIVNSTNEILQSISFDSSSIMMSLQVQDITSQQIAAVNHLLTTVQEKLSNIMKKFQNSDIGNLIEEESEIGMTNVSKMHRDIAFDPEAVDSITKKDTRQSEVDSFMEEQNNKKDDDNDSPSEEDISKLFDNPDEFLDKEEQTEEANTDSVDNNKKSNNDDNIAENQGEDDSDEEFSQEDIDALFGN